MGGFDHNVDSPPSYPASTQLHLEAAAAAGITPHLCRLAREASLGSGDPILVRQRQEQWLRFRGLVVPMLIGMVACSSITRAKLWSADGVEVFLMLLREQVRDSHCPEEQRVRRISATRTVSSDVKCGSLC